MSLYKQFKTSAKIETEGVVLEYGLNSQGQQMSIRIARAGGSNLSYSKRLEARTKPFRRQIQTETLDITQIEKILRDVFAETVVLGWENIEDSDGRVLEYSKANCLKLFDDLPELFKDIQEQAQRLALFREDILEADAKN